MRSKTKERHFTYSERNVPKHAPSKASQARSNNKRTFDNVECPECQSMNCKQRVFNIKCYDCGVVIQDE